MARWEAAARRDFDPSACAAAGLAAGPARRVAQIRDHLVAIARREGARRERRSAPEAVIRRCIFAGFSDELARRSAPRSPRCAVVHGRSGTLARTSVVRDDDLFVAAEINEIEGAAGKGTVRLALATAVEPAWLPEVFPADLRTEDDVAYDHAQKRVVARRTRFFRDLPIEVAISLDVPIAQAAEILVAEVLAGAIELRAWDRSVESWIARVNCLSAWCPEHGIEPFTDDDRRAVVEQIVWGATTAKEVREKPVWPVLRNWYNPGVGPLVDRLCPERIVLPSGRRPAIAYEAGRPPSIAARIQDLYDAPDRITVAGGKVRVLIDILAPNRRTVHITDDLGSFWRDHYPKIRQTLRQRYSKHEWR